MTIVAEIINWYTINKRDLPWRNTKNPYKIWLSEIILQQTRVVQGISYYYKFIENFNTVRDLAEADEEKVLKLWQGLGYYSRARNLHATAKIIQQEYNGVFPKTYKEVRQLKGIGDYTAAAIVSFAYNSPYACVDGNVYRVLSRIYGINTAIDSAQGRKEFFTLANELLPINNALLYNQAMMEFGAMQCVPKNPKCEKCIVKEFCFAFKENKVAELPVKEKKTKQRNRYFYYFFVEDEKNNTILLKRNKKDIWQHLYEFPLIEKETNVSFNEISKDSQFLNIIENNNYVISNVSKQYKHILSHQIIYTVFICVKIKKIKKSKNIVQINLLQKYAVSRLMHIYMQDAGLVK